MTIAPNKKHLERTEQGLLQPSLFLQLMNKFLPWVIVLIVLIALLVGYVFFLHGKISEVKNAAQENLPAKEKILSDLIAIKSELDGVVLDFGLFKQQRSEALSRFDILLPQGKQYGDLFAMASALAAQSGFTLNSIHITFADTAVDPKKAAAASTDSSLKKISLHVSASGPADYEAFKGYIRTLERNIRLMDVKSLSFQGPGIQAPAAAGGKTAQTSYDIDVTTYYQE